jgi:hypothetical protein
VASGSTKKARRTQPLDVIEGRPPKGAKIADAWTIAQAPKSGCGPGEWTNAGVGLDRDPLTRRDAR